MSAGAGGDGYMTRGRAAAIERKVDKQVAALTARCDELQRQLDDLRGRQVDLPRALAAAALDVVRSNHNRPPAAVPDQQHRGAI